MKLASLALAALVALPASAIQDDGLRTRFELEGFGSVFIHQQVAAPGIISPESPEGIISPESPAKVISTVEIQCDMHGRVQLQFVTFQSNEPNGDARGMALAAAVALLSGMDAKTIAGIISPEFGVPGFSISVEKARLAPWFDADWAARLTGLIATNLNLFGKQFPADKPSILESFNRATSKLGGGSLACGAQ